MGYQENITNEEINGLPMEAFGGSIVVVETDEQMKAAAEHLAGCPIVGFDTESRPSFTKDVVNRMALIQLSSETHAFLIRIHKQKLSKELIGILEDEHILKVGASVRDDIKGIQKRCRFTARGFMDLQSMVGDYGIKDQSLKKITAIVLGRRISKAQRLSNWEAKELTPSQQRYAATDAWICREIYLRLTKGKNGK